MGGKGGEIGESELTDIKLMFIIKYRHIGKNNNSKI